MAESQKYPCAGLTKTFFPDDDVTEAVAKSICATCPFRDECLLKGLNEREGIWGGTNERERRSIRKALNASTTTDD